MILNKLIERQEIKSIKRLKGYPICYVMYKPLDEIPNIIYMNLTPELQQDEVINELSKELAWEIRRWYKEHPEELERVKGLITRAREE